MSGRDGFQELGIETEADAESEVADRRAAPTGHGCAAAPADDADFSAEQDAAAEAPTAPGVGTAAEAGIQGDAEAAADPDDADALGSVLDLGLGLGLGDPGDLEDIAVAELDDAPSADIRRSPAVLRRLRARRWRAAAAIFALGAVLAGAGAFAARNIAVAGIERSANEAVAARAGELRAAIETEAADAIRGPAAASSGVGLTAAPPSAASIVADAVAAVEHDRGTGGGMAASERLLVLDGAGQERVGEPNAGEQSGADAKWRSFAASIAGTDAWSGVVPDPDGGSIRWGRAEATLGDAAVSVVAARSTAEERRNVDLLALACGGAGVLVFALLAFFAARRGRSLLRVADAFEALDADMNGADDLGREAGADAGAGAATREAEGPVPARQEPAGRVSDESAGRAGERPVDDDLIPARPNEESVGALAFVELVERDAREAPGAGISIDDLNDGAVAPSSRG